MEQSVDCRNIFRKGMKVLVSDDLSITERKFSLVQSMNLMKGTIQEVESVEQHGVRFAGCIWHGGDLIIVDGSTAEMPAFKPLMFDPKDLTCSE